MRKFFIKILFLILLIVGIVFIWGYQQIFAPVTNFAEDKVFYIPSTTVKTELSDLLLKDSVIKNASSFERVSSWMKFEKVKPGRYVIEPKLSNRQLVSLFRSGKQSPVNLIISNARTIDDIASLSSKIIEADSFEIINSFLNLEWLKQHDFNKENVVSIVIPNTYQFYWNTSGKEFVERMKSEYDKFWKQKSREAKLKELGLTKKEISVLASVVEKESIQQEERPIIAGVYLNRIKRGIPLQADPTVVFAVGDFNIRRVLNRHLEFDSPYNTYKYSGLPPGPICMPSISSLDAVLNAENHDYLFFCAKPGYNGSHAFARTNAEHERNARVYRRWLNKVGIRG